MIDQLTLWFVELLSCDKLKILPIYTGLKPLGTIIPLSLVTILNVLILNIADCEEAITIFPTLCNLTVAPYPILKSCFSAIGIAFGWSVIVVKSMKITPLVSGVIF